MLTKKGTRHKRVHTVQFHLCGILEHIQPYSGEMSDSGCLSRMHTCVCVYVVGGLTGKDHEGMFYISIGLWVMQA